MSGINTDKVFVVNNPATGEEVAKYPPMDREAVDAAVARARDKFARWSETSFKERRRILKSAASILAENAEHYAGVIAAENGKTTLDALLADISTVCDVLHYYAKNAGKFLKPVRVSGNPLLPGRKAYYVFEPKGVVGVISPWNYPFTLSAGPVVTAIAAGNTVVLKPSSQTTASGLILKEILEKAGLPKGVLEVVTGSGSVTGQALVDHPDLDMLFFTGSTEVGRMVNIKAAERLIPAVMELGGKDVAIVTANADLDRAAHSIVWGAFTNAGQTCIGIEIAIVHRSVYEDFLKKALEITETINLGKGPGEVGSMTMASQLKIVEEQVADAVEKGAKILTGGKRDENMKGMYFPPTILTDVTLDMKVMKEETFGPLLPIIPYDAVDEAIGIANSTPYGLAGAVFTKDMEEARRIAKRMDTGSVNVNDTLITFAIPSLPFGGVKNSGVGRYHSHVGIQAFTNIKSITEFNWDLKKEFYHYPMQPGVEPGLLATLRLVYSNSLLKRLVALIKVAPFLIKAVSKTISQSTTNKNS